MPAPKPDKHRLSYRMMIRLSPEQLAQLRSRAKKAGLAESSLARAWVVERLATEGTR